MVAKLLRYKLIDISRGKFNGEATVSDGVKHGGSMKLLTLCAAVLVLGGSFGAGYFFGTRHDSVYRERARELAFVVIQDGTSLVKEPGLEQFLLQTDGMTVSYSPQPIFTVTEWSESGVIGEPRGIVRGQWSCFETYTLKLDGDIPYCETKEQP